MEDGATPLGVSAPGANVRVTATGAPLDRTNGSGPNTCVVAAVDTVVIAELDGRSVGDVAASVQASITNGVATAAANNPNLMRGLRRRDEALTPCATIDWTCCDRSEGLSARHGLATPNHGTARYRFAPWTLLPTLGWTRLTTSFRAKARNPRRPGRGLGSAT